MPTNFPTSVDVLTNPVSNDSLNSPSHSAQHANANDAIEAIETFLLPNGAGNSGLIKIIPTGATGGTVAANGDVTIGNAVSSVTVSGAFSATYENYKIIVSGGTATGQGTLQLQLSGGATNYSYVGTAQQFGNSTVINLVAGPTSLWDNSGRISPDGNNMNVDLFSPFSTCKTPFRSTCTDYSAGGYIITTGGFHNASVSHTGFTISTVGTMTGGTIRVYGYK